MASKRKPRAVDLFCGAGGMSLGFEQAGFDIVAAADIDRVHVETYRKNFVHTRAHTLDLSAVCGDELRSLAHIPASIDVVFGGPPCQGFSLIGKREINDPRNHLMYHFGRLVVQLSPRYFVLENVPGIELVLDELGKTEATWVFEVERLGPFFVDMDAHGGNYFRRWEAGQTRISNTEIRNKLE